MSNVNWNDLIRESKNILIDGNSNFEGILALNEIINIIFLVYGEMNNNNKSVYASCCVKNIYKKYCKKYDECTNKNKINDDIDHHITNLFHFMYGDQSDSVINKFLNQFGILLHTNFNIEHKYDLANLIIKIYHSLNKKKFKFDKLIINCMYTYLQKFSPELFLPEHMIKSVIEEIDPKYNEIGSDENCGIGNFLSLAYNYIKKHGNTNDENNISGSVYDENIYKIASFNLLCNDIDFKNVKYNTFLNEENYDKRDTCDYIFGCCDVTNKCARDIPKNVKFKIATNNNVAMQIQMCLHKLKKGGRCGLIIPWSILYNNGVNKNSSSLTKSLMLTWEYNIRKLLLDENNLYKIIFFPNCNLAALFFIKGQTTNNVQLVDQLSNNTIKVSLKKLENNNYCLMYHTYEENKEFNTLDQLKTINFVQSKVIRCNIDNKEHERLNYRNIMHTIFLKIGRNKIKKHTRINIEYGLYTDKGYKYIEELDVSVQGTDAPTTIYEIIHQCKKHKIKLDMGIQLDNGAIIKIVC